MCYSYLDRARLSVGNRSATLRQGTGMRVKTFYLFVACWVTHSCFAQIAEDCASLPQAAKDETLVAWNSRGPVRTQRGADGPIQTKYGQLRVVAIVKDGQIRQPRNAVLERGASLWNVLETDHEIVLTDIYAVNYLFRPGISWCLFSAEIDQSGVEENALFTNNREFHLREPTESEQAAFDADMYPLSYCANRAGMFLRDTPPEDIPPCDGAKLIGLSDIDGNQRPEFWATEVLRYSTGIAIWEYSGTRYEKVNSACPGCSD